MGEIATKEVVRVRNYKAGYRVRTELVDGSAFGCDDFEVKSAYTPDGHYIGDPKLAYRLCKVRGIKPEPRPPETYSGDTQDYNDGAGPTCCIGFSDREQKWYGWSHRAIFGFEIGHIIESEMQVGAHAHGVGFEVKTLEDAKMLAVTFASHVKG